MYGVVVALTGVNVTQHIIQKPIKHKHGSTEPEETNFTRYQFLT